MVWMRRVFALVVFVAVLVGGWRFAHLNSLLVNFDYHFGSVDDVPFWLMLVVTPPLPGLGVVVLGLPLTVPYNRPGVLAICDQLIPDVNSCIGRLTSSI